MWSALLRTFAAVVVTLVIWAGSALWVMSLQYWPPLTCAAPDAWFVWMLVNAASGVLLYVATAPHVQRVIDYGVRKIKRH